VANPSVSQWFNTAAFAIPAEGTFGNSGRNTLRGPGVEDVTSRSAEFPDPTAARDRQSADPLRCAQCPQPPEL